MKTLSIATSKLDRNFERFDLKGFKLFRKKSTLILDSFNSAKVIGKAFNIRRENDELKADCEFNKEIDGYPAIGFIPLKTKENKDGTRDIQKFKLVSVAISDFPNPDSNIKKVSEQ